MSATNADVGDNRSALIVSGRAPSPAPVLWGSLVIAAAEAKSASSALDLDIGPGPAHADAVYCAFIHLQRHAYQSGFHASAAAVAWAAQVRAVLDKSL